MIIVLQEVGKSQYLGASINTNTSNTILENIIRLLL